MKTKVIVLAGLSVASALMLAGWLHFRQVEQRGMNALESAHAHEPEVAIDPPLAIHSPGQSELTPMTGATPPRVPDPLPLASLPSAIPTGAGAPDRNIPASPPSAGNPAGKPPKPPLQDPTARVAMALVGADLDAEAYWREAIFDPSLPEEEREDLMEDLNEEGLSDHKRPSAEDLPLIMSRLALLDEIAPDADEFMLTHLWEAYKDLVNLADITQGKGEPVR